MTQHVSGGKDLDTYLAECAARQAAEDAQRDAFLHRKNPNQVARELLASAPNQGESGQGD